MAAIDRNPRLPVPGSPDFDQQLYNRLHGLLQAIATQLNALSEDRLGAHYAALTAPPQGGKYAQGDCVKNTGPVEQGAAGSKYVIDGWVCVASGEPGTWVERRVLTGN